MARLHGSGLGRRGPLHPGTSDVGRGGSRDDWTYDPFKADAEADGWFYGRGIDRRMKGADVAVLSSLLRMKKEGASVPEHRHLIVAFTADEEAGRDARTAWSGCSARASGRLVDRELAASTPDAGRPRSRSVASSCVGVQTKRERSS